MIPRLVTGYSIDTSKIEFNQINVYKYGKLVIITGYGRFLEVEYNVECISGLPTSIANAAFFTPWASHNATGYGNFYIYGSKLIYNNGGGVDATFIFGLVYLTQ